MKKASRGVGRPDDGVRTTVRNWLGHTSLLGLICRNAIHQTQEKLHSQQKGTELHQGLIPTAVAQSSFPSIDTLAIS